MILFVIFVLAVRGLVIVRMWVEMAVAYYDIIQGFVWSEEIFLNAAQIWTAAGSTDAE
jgi:hypothetical protein